MDTYLRLSRLEEVRFERAIAGSKLAPAEKEQVMEIVTSWMETGIERGIEQGIERGERELFLRMARRRLGEPDAATLARVQAVGQETIEQWADRLMEIETWQELIGQV